MQEGEQLSQLIGDIYDAALDPAQWSPALRKSRAFVGGASAALYSKNAVRKTGRMYCQEGDISREFQQLYMEKYAKLDPFSTGHFFAEIEQPIATTDVMPYEEFLATRFYKEWVQPQGLVDNVTAALHKSSTSAVLFTIFRHERNGLVDDDARHRMRLIIPHIRRAVLIGRVIRLQAAQAATFADTLDGISAGMVLVDARGRIVHANASGHAMLAESSVLRAAGGKLAANSADAEEALYDVILAAGSGDAAVGTKGIAVPLTTSAGERYVAHVLPLTSGARRRAGTSYAAVAALFVHKAALDRPSPPEAIAKTFKLTPSELRVLLGIVEVGGAPETAAALGIGEATVRTHLLRLYAKTGTGRQAELVKLVAGFSNPLVA
jgi:DNA-binding CsgD family transcriptional regulator/PAS domain-containing protein